MVTEEQTSTSYSNRHYERVENIQGAADVLVRTIRKTDTSVSKMETKVEIEDKIYTVRVVQE